MRPGQRPLGHFTTHYFTKDSFRAMHLAVIVELCSLVLAAPPVALPVDTPLDFFSERPSQTLPLNLTAPLPKYVEFSLDTRQYISH